MGREPADRSPRSRNATSRELEKAALTLLKKDGVLAGLNLREVADLAGVNRGLVYHYFGSRGELLRAALRRDSERRSDSYRVDPPGRTVVKRIELWTRMSMKYAEQLRLVAILLLDGGTRVRLMPRRDVTQHELQDDQEAGAIGPNVDLIALHALLQAHGIGYAITRTQLAKEFGIGVRDLDARMVELMERIAVGLESDRD
ncbi:TetR family transcriptional regulator [Antricoccus suffuscus]|uniref:TetR family transcriptional regulator n=1 Tax=Antricoccus suffuscus TaxID=1629062 RepID=A0A2T1A5V0_9ACTN|nr:TetR/AcrR family transcriptional regulator [Antricoccus suffuscus]PRZ43966.1 TetR family transcriptional regulator [Antricoccus suffuscus]